MYKRIKEVREAFKLSQAKFGKSLGSSRDIISNIESQRTPPSEVIINSICIVYGIDRSWLNSGVGCMFRSTNDSISILSNAIAVFSSLTPSFQDYAIVEIQNIYDSELRSKSKIEV